MMKYHCEKEWVKSMGAPTLFSQFIILKRCEQKYGGTSHCEKEGGKVWVHLIW